MATFKITRWTLGSPMTVQYGPVFGTIRLLKIYNAGSSPTYGELTPGASAGVINATASEFNTLYAQLDSLHGSGTVYLNLVCDDESTIPVIVRHVVPQSSAQPGSGPYYPERRSPDASISALLEQVDAVRQGLEDLGASLRHRPESREEARAREYYIPKKEEMSVNGSA